MEKLVRHFRKRPEDPELVAARERLERLENRKRLEILEKRLELMRRQHGTDRDSNSA